MTNPTMVLLIERSGDKMIKIKAVKRVTLDRLRRADQQTFAELSEKAGYLEEAFRYYSKQEGSRSLFHAADIAFELGKYKTVKELVKKAREYAVENLRRRKESPGRGMGAAYSMSSAMNEEEESRKRVSDMESKLAQMGK